MTNNIFGCWYEPGDVGTWLTWFINQHNGYPKFTKKLRYEQEGNTAGHIATDYSCYGADWHVDESIKFADIKPNLYNDQYFKYNKESNPDYNHICYKILPWHNPLSMNPEDCTQGLTPTETCVSLLEDSNTDAIIMPVVEKDYELFAKRLAFIRPRFTVQSARDSYLNRLNRLYDNHLQQMRVFATVHTVAVDKLIIHNDETEYNKLVNILQQPALENWKDLTTDYYNTIFAPLIDINDQTFDSREETLAGNGRDPY